MKPLYSNIRPKPGAHVAGLIKVNAVPREWLNSGLVIDFNSGKVINAIELVPGKSWLTLDFTPDSYQFEEKQKTSKSGSYFETSLTGTSNDLDAAALQTLETYRYHEFIALVKDRQKRTRVIGDKGAGLVPQLTNKQSNSNSGNLVVTLDFTMQQELAAPFYDDAAGPGGTVTIGTSSVFLVPLNNDSIQGDVTALQAAYRSAASTDINRIYSVLLQVATEGIVNVAFANSNGLELNDYLVGIDLSSLQGFINDLSTWLATKGYGQSLQLQGNQLRVVDATAVSAFFAIAVPRNLFGDDTVLLAAY